MAPRHNFDTELEALNNELIRMSLLTEKAIESSIHAFDSADKELAREVIAKDREINDMEKLIEAKCLSLILRQQPVARDLRVVSTALKMVTDVERIGDHAADIAEIVIHMDDAHGFELARHIPEMASAAKHMVHDAVEAFVNSNIENAKKVMQADDKVDELFNKVKNDIIEILKTEEKNYDVVIDILMISKYLERIGDHAVNICEWIEFNQTGEYKNFRMI